MKVARRPKLAVPERKDDSHKGQNGLVLVIGGSKDYVGAPALAGLAALRAGCDIVNIAAPEKAAWAINALSPDLITTKLKGDFISTSHVDKLTKLSKRFDAVVLGSGMSSVSKSVINNLIRGISKNEVPMVIDADAVKVAEIKNIRHSILTPHSRELELFLETNKRTLLLNELGVKRLPDEKKVSLMQQNLGDLFLADNVLLLKGRSDMMLAMNRSLILRGGNAGMSVGGTGDVLAGLCVGYLAQTADLFLSAGMASQECKKIGDALLKKSNFGFGFIASDFLHEVKKLDKREVE